MRRPVLQPPPPPPLLPLLLLLLPLLTVSLARGVGGSGGRLLLDGRDPVGSPGELAWQAWLLMDSRASAAADEGGPVAMRRITPKSVFIAPAFSPQALPACADGYRADSMGRCVKLVRVNQAAQLDFLLQRLNAMYAAAAPPPAMAAAEGGPLQFPLSIATGPEPESEPEPEPEPELQPPKEVPPSPPPPQTPSTSSPTFPPPSSSLAPSGQSGDTEETQVSSTPSPDSPDIVRVSVVMADVSKRSSAELQKKLDNPSPLISVWSLEESAVLRETTLAPEAGTDSDGAPLSALTVEMPTSTEPTVATEEETSKTTEVPVSTEVLAPLDVVGSLPMLVISPESTAPPTASPLEETTPLEGSGEADSTTESPQVNREKIMHSTETPEIAEHFEVESVYASIEDEEPVKNSTGKQVKEKDTSGQVDSGETMERVEVVPISEQARLQLPLLADVEDQEVSFSQSGFGSGRVTSEEQAETKSQSKDNTPTSTVVRFPSESEDEPHSVHLFKGNFIKFPSDDAYRYKHKPAGDTTPPLQKQTYWWLPPGWRLDHQQHHPTLLRFWSHMPLNTESSLLNQYSASYHPPLPYQQRQAQYDPQWSLRRHLT